MDSSLNPSLACSIVRFLTGPQSKAEYTLQSAAVYSKDESGAGKIARCLFADCIGINGWSSVSVQLVRTQNSAVLWAYQVRKGNSGPMGVQSLSEAIAKHLKHDYLTKHSEQSAPAATAPPTAKTPVPAATTAGTTAAIILLQH